MTLLATLALCVPPIGPPAPPIERVVFCASPCADAELKTAIVAGTVLGNVPNEGRWLALPQPAVDALRRWPDGLRILFYTRAEYSAAVRGLSAQDTLAVVRKRRDEFASHAVAYAGNLVSDDLIDALTLAARSGDAGRFARDLEELSSLTRTTRGLEPRALLPLLIEAQATLLAELQAAGEAMARARQPAQATAFTMAAGARQAAIDALATALAKRGDATFVASMPYVELQRGVWITPADRALLAELEAPRRGCDDRTPFLRWRGGVVLPQSARQISAREASGHVVHVLRLSAGDLRTDLGDLTEAQLLRELPTWLADGDTPAAWRRHISLLLRDTLLREVSARAAAAESGDAALATLLATQIAADSALLRRELAALASPLAADATALWRGLDDRIGADARLVVRLWQTTFPSAAERYRAIAERTP